MTRETLLAALPAVPGFPRHSGVIPHVLLAIAMAAPAAPGVVHADARLVVDLNQELRTYGAQPEEVVDVGGTLFFRGCDDAGGTGCELWKSDGTAAGTVLVRDIMPGVQSSSPVSLTLVNNTLFFVADEPLHWRELWKSDGTPEGTVRVSDIDDGSVTACPNTCAPAPLTAVHDLVFFSACDSGNDCELWKSDGTTAGTARVKDINPLGGSRPVELTAVGGVLMFVACSVGSGFQLSDCGLWRSDGTEAGTTQVALWPGSKPSHLKELKGSLYFVLPTGLWRTDGTTAGTVLVSDIGASDPFKVTLSGDLLFFSRWDPVFGSELWKSDGTSAGTVLVKDIRPGEASSAPELLTNVDGTLFFLANAEPYPYGGAELWRTDGTPAGTILLREFLTTPAELTSAGGALYFRASEGGSDGLWRSDGTPAGTVLVKDVSPSFLTESGGALSFWANGLWRSDGTPDGTLLITAGAEGTEGSSPRFTTSRDGLVQFVADDGIHGDELWKSNGTPADATRITNLPLPTVLERVEIGAIQYLFTADADTGAEELWKSDGTPAGTAFVADLGDTGLTYLPFLRLPAFLPTAAGGTLYFSNFSGADSAYELWKSDGTAQGTVRLASFPRDPYTISLPLSLPAAIGDVLYFLNDTELWQTDGTEAGTVLVKSGLGTWPRAILTIDESLYILTDRALWKSDGTSAGTVSIVALNCCTGSLGPLAHIGGTVFFTGPEELVRSDGTAAGTAVVKDIRPGSDGSYPESLTEAGGVLYFTANDGIHGRELWRSDGTTAGTVLVRDIAPGPAGSWPSAFRSMNGALYFEANDGVHGEEPWMASRDGASLIADVFPGSGGSKPSEFAVSGSRVFFAARDEAVGSELWMATPEPDALFLGLASSSALLALARRRARASSSLRRAGEDRFSARQARQPQAAGARRAFGRVRGRSQVHPKSGPPRRA